MATSTNYKFVLRSQIPGISECFPCLKATEGLHPLTRRLPVEPQVPKQIPRPFEYKHLKGYEIVSLKSCQTRSTEWRPASYTTFPLIERITSMLSRIVGNGAEMNRLMRVNGHSFQVARTLEGTLVQFRRDLSTCAPGGGFDHLETLARFREEPSRSWPAKDMRRNLWIDATCID
jgi:hypothetical protein